MLHLEKFSVWEVYSNVEKNVKFILWDAWLINSSTWYKTHTHTQCKSENSCCKTLLFVCNFLE